MKVILLEDVGGLGQKNQLVNVKDGYAKNYLLKNNLAAEASPKNLHEMEMRRKSEIRKKSGSLESAQYLKERLDGKEVVIFSKAGENGKLFGSITSMDIVNRINQQYHIVIDKKKVMLEENIKHLGTYKVPVKVHTGISVTVKVIVTEMEQK